MLINLNGEREFENTLLETRPNMLFGCKKAIFAMILLAIVVSVSAIFVRSVAKIQYYLVSRLQLPLTQYTAIAFFIIVLIIVIYIIWQLISWYSTVYILTDSRVVIKKGLLKIQKNYMPYGNIQDVNTTQSIFARIFNIGTVSLYSGYDNNEMVLRDISNSSEVENIIFSNINSPKSYNNNNQQNNQNRDINPQYGDDYIIPSHNLRGEHGDFNYKHQNDYDEEYTVPDDNSIKYEPASNSYAPLKSKDKDYSRLNYHEPVRNEYYSNLHPDQPRGAVRKELVNPNNNAINRHFDKFKK